MAPIPIRKLPGSLMSQLEEALRSNCKGVESNIIKLSSLHSNAFIFLIKIQVSKLILTSWPLIISPLAKQPLFPFTCVLYLRKPLYSFNFILTAGNKGTNIYSMEEGECSTNLGLAIGGGGKEYKPSGKFHVLFPQHSLIMKEEEEDDDDYEDVEQSSKQNVSILRCTNFDEEETISGGENSRKKLKLTKEQMMLLEDNFREHKTLNTPQKQHLADRLNIQPRQVEVWFQNRRARTKLKQIEVDYEILRKHCDRLSDENQRLRQELQELQSRSP